MIDEEEEEKERQRLKKKKVERALKEKDDIDEEEPNWSPPEENEVEKRDRKPNRLRRPELRITRRDELWSDVWMEIILIDFCIQKFYLLMQLEASSYRFSR